MKLCIALDLPTKNENLELARNISGLSDDIWLKIGFRSYIRDGREFVEELKQLGFKLFLDLKLYDIPNTMADASEEIAKMGVDMFNIHASAGRVAMQTIMERLSKFENRPLVLAVTALTSFDEAGLRRFMRCQFPKKLSSLQK
jgi:orotidine-5'-phosphate decarboxylase